MKVAAIQLNSTADTAANLARAEQFTRAAAAQGAQLVVLPEKWSVLGRDEDLRAGAQTLDGPAIVWARALARELRIDLVAGSIVERCAGGEGDRPQVAQPEVVEPRGGGGHRERSNLRSDRVRARAHTNGAAQQDQAAPMGRLANTSVHVGPDGDVRATYRKLHMFDVEVAGRAYRESALTEPGSEIVLSTTADGVELGLAICYDLRFPGLFATLAARGARIVVLPSAFTAPTTRDHWEILVRARAIENEVFVLAANQVGAHPGGQRSGGRSLIVDPWGCVLADAGERPGPIVAELDLERQREIRRQLPVLAHRRPELYGAAA